MLQVVHFKHIAKYSLFFRASDKKRYCQKHAISLVSALNAPFLVREGELFSPFAHENEINLNTQEEHES